MYIADTADLKAQMTGRGISCENVTEVRRGGSVYLDQVPWYRIYYSIGIHRSMRKTAVSVPLWNAGLTNVLSWEWNGCPTDGSHLTVDGKYSPTYRESRLVLPGGREIVLHIITGSLLNPVTWSPRGAMISDINIGYAPPKRHA